ncbi:uncharacterized protein LOC124280494 [Haliotis rubra]|uniref:uncharacterized protein LOC124280494 n=1 Tax=Haliotis rubra TaxID=36100 RepID=UPI001EE55991|nr:uncharacterized protein LOC124280494 [Haliotis rubra]
MGAINCRGIDNQIIFIMRSLLVLCLLVLLTVAQDGGLRPHFGYSSSRSGGSYRRPGSGGYRRPYYYNDDHYNYHRNYPYHVTAPPTLPPTQPPTPPPTAPPFPSNLYNHIPEDLLGRALCIILGTDTLTNYKAYQQIQKSYGRSYTYIFYKILQLLMTTFKPSLSGLRDEAFSDLSSAGKAWLCNLLQNMPSSYTKCGFEQLIGVLSDQCTPGAYTPTTATITATTTLPTNFTAATTTTTTAAPSLNCNDLSTIRALAKTTRIMGGIAIQEGAYDSYASLNIGGSVNPVCGATIIDSCTILTASHCVEFQTADEIQVNVGNHTTIESTTMLNVNSFEMHENYSTQTTANDVAILKVDPIDFNAISNTAPACLATADYAMTGQDCTVVGFGATSFGNPRMLCVYPSMLFGYFVCQSEFAMWKSSTGIPESMIVGLGLGLT